MPLSLSYFHIYNFIIYISHWLPPPEPPRRISCRDDERCWTQRRRASAETAAMRGKALDDDAIPNGAKFIEAVFLSLFGRRCACELFYELPLRRLSLF